MYHEALLHPTQFSSPLCGLAPIRAALCRCYLGAVARPPAGPARELGMPRSA